MYQVAKNVQVRKESWGLLFYSQGRHRVSFVRSGDWLYPGHFDRTWTMGRMAGDIARRTGRSSIAVERSINKLIESLLKNGMITDELL